MILHISHLERFQSWPTWKAKGSRELLHPMTFAPELHLEERTIWRSSSSKIWVKYSEIVLQSIKKEFSPKLHPLWKILPKLHPGGIHVVFTSFCEYISCLRKSLGWLISLLATIHTNISVEIWLGVAFIDCNIPWWGTVKISKFNWLKICISTLVAANPIVFFY